MDYFVDKSEILKEIFPRLGTSNKYLCITRPRRFGKTIMANMIAFYFSRGVKSGPVFEPLLIGRDSSYPAYLNRHNVLCLDLSTLPFRCESYGDYIDFIAGQLLDDLLESYPGCGLIREEGPWVALEKIHSQTGEQFIFVIDEWDSMFHNPQFTKEYHMATSPMYGNYFGFTQGEMHEIYEIYSAMVVYRFLSYRNGRVVIPNKELMMIFQKVLRE